MRHPFQETKEECEHRKDSLRRFLHQTADQVRQKAYEYWAQQKEPVTYEEDFEGREVQVEIEILETDPSYVHIVVTASNSPLGWAETYSTDVVIRTHG